MSLSTSETHADILVAGAGAAGLSTALALAQAGFSVVCVGHVDTRANGRTVALFEAWAGSIGAFPDICPKRVHPGAADTVDFYTLRRFRQRPVMSQFEFPLPTQLRKPYAHCDVYAF